MRRERVCTVDVTESMDVLDDIERNGASFGAKNDGIEPIGLSVTPA